MTDLPEKLERRKDPNREWKEKILRVLKVAPEGLSLLNVSFLVSQRNQDMKAVEQALDELTFTGLGKCTEHGGKMLYTYSTKRVVVKEVKTYKEIK